MVVNFVGLVSVCDIEILIPKGWKLEDDIGRYMALGPCKRSRRRRFELDKSKNVYITFRPPRRYLIGNSSKGRVIILTK